jgi:hypothetical protein
MAKVNALQELQSASGEELRPALWADVDIVPEPFGFAQDKLREWDAVRVELGV